MELLKNRPRRVKEVKTTTSLLGVVLGPDGAPLDFALVAAVNVQDDPEAGRVPFVTTAINRGKFEIANLPPGNYGITVTAPASAVLPASPPPPGQEERILAGTFAGVVTAAAGEPGPPMLLRLGGTGIVLSGRVTDDKGAPIESALVRAVRESPFEGDSFFARTGADGAFTLGLPAGKYFLVGQADGKKPLRLDVGTERIQKDLLFRLPPALVLPGKDEMAAWVTSTGAVLTSPESNDDADLAKLDAIVGNARIVGLGEATYTGREIAKLKLRMYRHLAEKLGFSTLLIEATQADVRALNDYVVQGKGSLPEIVTKLGYFSLDTEESIDLFSWMRGYNEVNVRKRKLRVRGVDVQRTAAAATDLDLYLRKVDKAFAASVEDTMYRLRTNEFGTAFRDRPADEQETVVRDIEAIVATLDKKRRVYTAKARHGEWAQAVDDAASLTWAIRVYRDERQRGAALADVARRTIDAEPKGVRVAVWAHNTQVSRRPADGGMGSLLAAAYKTDYLPIGVTFYQGWIRAWDYTAGPTTDRGTKLFRLPPAEPGSLEALLETAGSPLFYADVRKAPPSLIPWFASRLPMRSVGTVFAADRHARTRTIVKDAFDALVFVHKLTTVKFNDTGKRPGRKEWD